MNTVEFLVQQTMFFSIPLLIVALGGMFSERGGVTNISLEGTMIFGAFASIFFINRVGEAMSGQGLLLLAILIAGLIGGLVSLLIAFSAINMNADQVIGGTAINILAPAFVIYFARSVQETGVQQVQFDNTFRIDHIPVLSDIPIIGGLFFENAYLTTLIGIVILIISAFVLYKTKFGLRLRACGENPQAADSVGINVYKIRYAGVFISGVLAGIGGLVFIIPTSSEFNATVAGYGFLALAVMIFGQWKPIRICFAAFFFGITKTIAATYSVIPVLQDLQITSEFYKMIPFVATLVLLAFTSKQGRAPAAVGKPYEKGSR